MRTHNPHGRSHRRWTVAGAALGGLGAVALLTGCSQDAKAVSATAPVTSAAPATSAAPPAVGGYFEQQTSATYTPPGSRTPSAGPPQPGGRIELIGNLYQGDHLHHSKDLAGTDHTSCVFDSKTEPHCDAQAAFGGSMLLISSTGGDGDFDSPITGGTGRFTGATGNVHNHPVEGTDNSDLTITVT
jgi:hypothetical protein